VNLLLALNSSEEVKKSLADKCSRIVS